MNVHENNRPNIYYFHYWIVEYIYKTTCSTTYTRITTNINDVDVIHSIHFKREFIQDIRNVSNTILYGRESLRRRLKCDDNLRTLRE